MKNHTNDLGQPIGFPIANWKASVRPPRSLKVGRLCRIEPLDPDFHAKALYTSFSKDTDDRNWTYLPYGPFDNFRSFNAWLKVASKGDDPMFHAIIIYQRKRRLGSPVI